MDIQVNWTYTNYARYLLDPSKDKKQADRETISLAENNIRVFDPVGYIEMLKLLHLAKAALTDSGGLQKEAFWLKTPCVTIRDRTEWIETVDIGVNVLAGTDPKRIVQAIKDVDEKYSEIKERLKRTLLETERRRRV